MAIHVHLVHICSILIALGKVRDNAKPAAALSILYCLSYIKDGTGD